MSEKPITEDRLEQVASHILDLCDDSHTLDFNVDSLHVAQIDEPWTDNSREIRLMLRTDDDTVKVKIINIVLQSDIPLQLESICSDHGQLAFEVIDN